MRFAVLLLSASAILAQNSATITGKVSDTDGAALAKAPIQAKNVATGAVYKTDSSPTTFVKALATASASAPRPCSVRAAQ